MNATDLPPAAHEPPATRARAPRRGRVGVSHHTALPAGPDYWVPPRRDGRPAGGPTGHSHEGGAATARG